MPEQAPLGEVVVPLAEETLAVSKREVETARVQVALTTETQTVVAREVLRGRRVEVEHVPVEPHDEPLATIATERELIRVGPAA